MYDIIYIYLEDLLAFPNLSAFPGTRSANEQGLLLMCLGACLCSEILYLCCEILQSKMSLHYYNARLLRFCWPRTLPQPLVRINNLFKVGEIARRLGGKDWSFRKACKEEPQSLCGVEIRQDHEMILY